MIDQSPDRNIHQVGIVSGLGAGTAEESGVKGLEHAPISKALQAGGEGGPEYGGAEVVQLAHRHRGIRAIGGNGDRAGIQREVIGHLEIVADNELFRRIVRGIGHAQNHGLN